MPEWDCENCDETIECATIDAMKEAAKQHLVENHRQKLATRFKENYSGEKCKSCSYRIPEETDAHDHLVCPECGHDHVDWWAGNLVAFVGQA